jgi:D-serine deaminase-like pyridoxal phosphate-dependent protein
MHARDVIEENRRRLCETEERIRHRPHTQAVRQGRVTVEALKAFPGHQYHMANSDARSLALLVSRYGASPSRSFFNDVPHVPGL